MADGSDVERNVALQTMLAERIVDVAKMAAVETDDPRYAEELNKTARTLTKGSK